MHFLDDPYKLLRVEREPFFYSTNGVYSISYIEDFGFVIDIY